MAYTFMGCKPVQNTGWSVYVGCTGNTTTDDILSMLHSKAIGCLTRSSFKEPYWGVVFQFGSNRSAAEKFKAYVIKHGT